ncbi:unnamed protein product [Linum trigynum]|uniref:DUF4283 domain-containing protein n=1 Tax=Linum trigynum TaxID=586398 RepID=A0AAV2G0A1_9ROSI
MTAVADGASSGAVGGGRSWASLFAVSEDSKLEFYELEMVNGSIRIPKAVMEEGARQWKHSLVGQFLGAPPSLATIRFWANWLWGREGEVCVSWLEDHLILFKFPTDAVCQ